MSLNIRNPIYSDSGAQKVDVLLDHPEFGTIPYSFDPNTADESYDFEVRQYIAGLEDGDIAPFVPYVESQEELDAKELAQAKTYLSDTDWVITKISEAEILGEDVSALKTQYQNVINERRAKRTRINELEPSESEA